MALRPNQPAGLQLSKPGVSRPIRVLIVDDSAVVRQVLTRDLSKFPGIEIVGTAPDPFVAREQVVALNPDVLTLDVEMPRMDGITFLRALSKHRPTPTIVLSSLTPKGSKTAIAAMEAGAIDVVCKPNGSFSAGDMAQMLADRIKIAARATVRAPIASGVVAPTLSMAETTEKIFAIGASTGGVQALTAVLTQFPANAPGTIVVQHMPAAFTGSFARRLNEQCKVNIAEARGGESVIPGQVLIAPGGRHMVLRRSGARYLVELIDGPEVHHQKPAVDVLFNSVARFAGANAVGAILTGMGADGAAGLLAMREAGARTLAQDETTSVVFGMPAEAIRLGAAERIVPLQDVTAAMLTMTKRLAA